MQPIEQLIAQHGPAVVFANVLLDQLGIGMVFDRQIGYLLAALDRAGSAALWIVAGLAAVYVGYKWWYRRRFFAMLRVARISVDELYQLMEAGEQPVVVDVRSPTART